MKEKEEELWQLMLNMTFDDKATYDRPALRACLFRGGVKTQTDTC